jgi:hypothetical protein
MSFAVGSLVKARGREWVVLPESDEQMLILRPLGGTEDEVTGIYVPLERVDHAHFDLPDPTQPGGLSFVPYAARCRASRFPLKRRSISLIWTYRR